MLAQPQPQPQPQPSSPRCPSAAPAGGSGGVRRDISRPLPDPVAIRLRPVPGAVPPYDDEGRGAGHEARADALAAAIVAALAAGPEARDGGADRNSAARGNPAAAGQAARAGGPAARPGPQRGQAAPPPPRWLSTFAQVLAETLAGSRPHAQIVPWTTERARTHIRGLGPLLAAGQRPLVQRVVTSVPAPGVMEMSVVVGFGPRVRALAVRLEQAAPRPSMPGRAGGQPRWLCTAVEAA